MTSVDEAPHVYESIELGHLPRPQVPTPTPSVAAEQSTNETVDDVVYYKVPRDFKSSPGSPLPAKVVKLRQRPPYLKSASEPTSMQTHVVGTGTSNRPKYASLEQKELTPSNTYSSLVTGDKVSLKFEEATDSTPVGAARSSQKVRMSGARWGRGLTVCNCVSGVIALVALLLAIISLSVSISNSAKKCDCSRSDDVPLEELYERLGEMDSRLNATEHDIAHLTENGLSALNDCQTSVASSCNVVYSVISTPPTYTLCETSPVPVDQPGLYTKSLQCGVQSLGGQLNPVVSTLLFRQQRKQAWCNCYLIVPSEDLDMNSTSDTVCSLFVTRCTIEP